MGASRPDDTAVPAFSFLPELENNPIPRDRAIDVPSVSPNYAADAYAKNWLRSLPRNGRGQA